MKAIVLRGIALQILILPLGTWASSTELFGGSGGQWFSRQCPPGEIMVGINGQPGRWVDSASIVCAPVANNRWSRAQAVASVGGKTGALAALIGPSGSGEGTCPRDRYVSALTVSIGSKITGAALPGPFVHAIRPSCRLLVAPQSPPTTGPGVVGSDAGNERRPHLRLLGQSTERSVARLHATDEIRSLVPVGGWPARLREG